MTPDFLRRLVAKSNYAYIILDTLDESPRDGLREQVLEAIERIRGWGVPCLHLFVTCRNEPDTRDSLGLDLASENLDAK